MSRIEKKWALVTGASSGIGEACSRRFAAEGANLILWARRVDRLENLAAELSGDHGVSVEWTPVDVRDRRAVDDSAADLIGRDRVPYVLLNNAGLAAGLAPVQAGDPVDWDRMIDTNVKGLLNVSRALLPAMIERGEGHVVNIGSTAGHQVYPSGNVYNATKFAVRALSEGMNLDLAGTTLRVSSVDPGLVKTEFSEVRFHGDDEKAAAVYVGLRPLGPEDVADAVFYVVNAPAHVNVADLVLLPTAQRNVYVLDRTEA